MKAGLLPAAHTYWTGGQFQIPLGRALPEPCLSDVVDRLAKAWEQVSRQPARRRIGKQPMELTAAI